MSDLTRTHNAIVAAETYGFIYLANDLRRLLLQMREENPNLQYTP